MFRSKRGGTVQLLNNREGCPRCGRLSPVIDGTYAFDERGIATALSAPAWSIDALRAIQEPLRLVATKLADPAVADDAAERIVERVVEMLEKRDAATAAAMRASTKGKPRSKVLAVVMAMLVAIGAVVDLHDAGEIAGDVGAAIADVFDDRKASND